MKYLTDNLQQIIIFLSFHFFYDPHYEAKLNR